MSNEPAAPTSAAISQTLHKVLPSSQLNIPMPKVTPAGSAQQSSPLPGKPAGGK